MTWREEAKELDVSVYDHTLNRPRKKEDVIADIEAKKNPPCLYIKVIISPREAHEICSKALYKTAVERGLKAGTITNEKWFMNCKRKGIVFKGQKEI